MCRIISRMLSESRLLLGTHAQSTQCVQVALGELGTPPRLQVMLHPAVAHRGPFHPAVHWQASFTQ